MNEAGRENSNKKGKEQSWDNYKDKCISNFLMFIYIVTLDTNGINKLIKSRSS